MALTFIALEMEYGVTEVTGFQKVIECAEVIVVEDSSSLPELNLSEKDGSFQQKFLFFSPQKIKLPSGP